MPRREHLSDFEEDDEPVIEETKEKKKKEKKTLVFEIKLAEDVNEKYEYNYKEMVKEHEDRMKKVDSDIEIIEILDDDPVPKKKKEKKTLVFEIKLSEDYEYNYKEMVKEHEERMKKVDSDIEIIEILDDDPVPKKKKYKKPVHVDPEDEYDLDDDFIDDTEANDEVVPDQVSTEHGGFYINIGRLKYVELDSGSTGKGGERALLA